MAKVFENVKKTNKQTNNRKKYILCLLHACSNFLDYQKRKKSQQTILNSKLISVEHA